METRGSEKELHESVIMPWTPNFSDVWFMAKQPASRDRLE